MFVVPFSVAFSINGMSGAKGGGGDGGPDECISMGVCATPTCVPERPEQGETDCART